MSAAPYDSRVSLWHKRNTWTTNVIHGANIVRNAVKVVSAVTLTLMGGIKLGHLMFEAFQWLWTTGLVW